MIPDQASSRKSAGRLAPKSLKPAKGDRLSRLRDSASFLLGGLLIAGTSAILVWPLWKLSTTNRILYSVLTGMALLAFALWKLARRLFARGISRARKSDPGS